MTEDKNINNNFSCCFTGHRKIKKEDIYDIKLQIKNSVINLIENGIKIYYSGGALGFDTIASEIIIELKKEYKNIKLYLILPCKNQTKFWNNNDILIYNDILKKADHIKYLSEHYFDGCNLKRNRYLVDNSNFCIAYLKHKRTGTSYTVNYAIQKKLNIIYIK